MRCSGTHSYGSVFLFFFITSISLCQVTTVTEIAGHPEGIPTQVAWSQINAHPSPPPRFETKDGTSSEMGPCDSKHDPKGEVTNCECFSVSRDWPAALWENVTDLSNYAPRTDTIRAGCKQVSGLEYQYGHGTANSSMEARIVSRSSIIGLRMVARRTSF